MLKLQSDLVSGDVTTGVIESLPFDGIQLLLGNDLAGDKVNPILTDKPCPQHDPAEQVIPDLYPSCAVTRAMKERKESDSMQKIQVDEIDLSNTILFNTFKNSEPMNERRHK